MKNREKPLKTIKTGFWPSRLFPKNFFPVRSMIFGRNRNLNFLPHFRENDLFYILAKMSLYIYESKKFFHQQNLYHLRIILTIYNFVISPIEKKLSPFEVPKIVIYWVLDGCIICIFNSVKSLGCPVLWLIISMADRYYILIMSLIHPFVLLPVAFWWFKTCPKSTFFENFSRGGGRPRTPTPNPVETIYTVPFYSSRDRILQQLIARPPFWEGPAPGLCQKIFWKNIYDISWWYLKCP